jgi:hypothetical protein
MTGYLDLGLLFVGLILGFAVCGWFIWGIFKALMHTEIPPSVHKQSIANATKVKHRRKKKPALVQ